MIAYLYILLIYACLNGSGFNLYYLKSINDVWKRFVRTIPLPRQFVRVFFFICISRSERNYSTSMMMMNELFFCEICCAFNLYKLLREQKNLFRKGLIYTGKTALWCADIYPLQQLIDCLWSRCTMYMDIYMDAIYSQIVYCQFFCFALWQSWIVCARKERGRLNRVEACIQ